MLISKHGRASAIYLLLTLGALITLAPFGLGLLTSFTPARQFATGTPLSWPHPPTLDNFGNLGSAGFGRAAAIGPSARVAVVDPDAAMLERARRLLGGRLADRGVMRALGLSIGALLLTLLAVWSGASRLRTYVHGAGNAASRRR